VRQQRSRQRGRECRHENPHDGRVAGIDRLCSGSISLGANDARSE